MAKGSGPPRKKTAKYAEPVPTPGSRLRKWIFRPRRLLIAATLAGTAVLSPWWWQMLPSLDDRPEYAVGPGNVVISPPPSWIPEDLTQQAFKRAGLGDRESLQNEELSERIAAAFHTHPWIQRVVSVRKEYPAKVHVELVYREPVAMVRGVDGYYPVDRFGVLLPARDFHEIDVERLPLIDRVASVPLGGLGEPWGDPVVAGAAELAALLIRTEQGTSWWKELSLSSILVPRRVALSDAADDLQYELRTIGGSEILWGRGPSSRHPGELSVAQKIQRLVDFRNDYGGFDDQHGPYQIDIRPWQGIQRGLLAREPGLSRLQ